MLIITFGQNEGNVFFLMAAILSEPPIEIQMEIETALRVNISNINTIVIWYRWIAKYIRIIIVSHISGVHWTFDSL